MEPMHGDRGAGTKLTWTKAYVSLPSHIHPLRLNKIECFHIEHWYYLTLSYLVTDIECSTTWHEMP